MDVYQFSKVEGFIETHIRGVSFFWATKAIACSPLVYNAGLVIIEQGNKVGYLGDRVFHYDSDHYLVLSVPLTFECKTNASLDNPLLGLFIELDLAELHKMVMQLSKHNALDSFELTSPLCGVEPVALDSQMRKATTRLMQALCSEQDSEILGLSLVREVVYRALLGKHGPALYALTQHNSHYARIARSIEIIRREYQKPLTIKQLAKEVDMSVSAFHRSFKQITEKSPLQYLKEYRLHKAKSLILHNNISVGTAALNVGYESTSQFSREFKRYFNFLPSQARDSGYAQLV